MDTFRRGLLIMLLLGSVALAGCYVLQKSSGSGQASFSPPRQVNAADVALPAGYRVEAVATGLTFPTGVTFDDQGRVYVVESGYSYGEVWTKPRLLRVEANGQLAELAVGGRNGPWTGVTFHGGNFYVAEGGVLEGGRIVRITPDGTIAALVSNLPSHGDHHTDGPVIGPDGWLYFGQGTASNSGVVGVDNAEFGWLNRFPDFHDIPAKNITLSGQNFTTPNPLKPGGGGKVTTGAFLPFGTASFPGQVIKGQMPCNGAILRIRPEGDQLELVAWGLRNPFGLAFGPQGRLYVTENSYDVRGSRPVWGVPDVLWRIEPGTWYGWPDFAAGMPLTDSRFKPPFESQPKFLLASHPNPPPKPVAMFGVHSSANGFDFSRNPAFGHVGEAFVALFGDQAPVVGKTLHPVGNKVVRVNVENGVIQEFAVNKGRVHGPASKIGGGGLERPVAARFTPGGEALYVVDFGVMLQDKHGSYPQPGTGVLWRISRDGRQ
ncbi:MAG TPA: glucose dehydrogenase [Clostridia bacterium]|nr:glucose dehydrogenase [Clostridia bacterium]